MCGAAHSTAWPWSAYNRAICRRAWVRQIDRSIAVAEATFTTAIKPRTAPASGKGGLSRKQSASLWRCETLLMRRDIGVRGELVVAGCDALKCFILLKKR